MTEEIIFNY